MTETNTRKKYVEMNNKKILVVTVESWNSKVGLNTWPTLLAKFPSENIANICIRDEIPDSDICSRYFSISESKVLKSILKRKIKTGSEVKASCEANDDTLSEHNKRYAKFTKKRRYSMLLARELVWKMGKWKTKELNEFLDSFKPDIILYAMEGYIHLNSISKYAIKRTGAKAIGYIWDDNFTYKQQSNFGYKLYRFFQRKSLKRLAKVTNGFFAISEKTKREADEFFKINSVVLTKPLSSVPSANYGEIKKPIKMLYTGNLFIGRDRSLLRLVNAIKKLGLGNEFEIDVYTNTHLKDEMKSSLECSFCRVHPPIPQSEVLKKQKKADVLLFLEDVDGKYANFARLSFSTKITDYLSAGRCIFAVGNVDTAPTEYLKENKAAIVATNDSELEASLKEIAKNPSVLADYARVSSELGVKNHSKEKIEQIFADTLNKVLAE